MRDLEEAAAIADAADRCPVLNAPQQEAIEAAKTNRLSTRADAVAAPERISDSRAAREVYANASRAIPTHGCTRRSPGLSPV